MICLLFFSHVRQLTDCAYLAWALVCIPCHASMDSNTYARSLRYLVLVLGSGACALLSGQPWTEFGACVEDLDILGHIYCSHLSYVGGIPRRLVIQDAPTTI
ncbi:hypothetical protein BO78DRAFT_215225 [Aspergillus sclerotiicarbonarius CBS 121057]|uniref:Uncharacterized protein n=1 Tax=Aspergillus sclerotiicarbonarius (strain CBS 121057 / IBT 28362) TaxID=1448318 RepID=A0A319DXW0_ASPSB|nr:hypothetical protein BO78DRAFT_215225 [Aspergillus sclerotiicarbonarius CBS 121057]